MIDKEHEKKKSPTLHKFIVAVFIPAFILFAAMFGVSYAIKNTSGDSIRVYLIENPEVLVEASQALQEKMQKMQEEGMKKALDEVKGDLYKSSASPCSWKSEWRCDNR